MPAITEKNYTHEQPYIICCADDPVAVEMEINLEGWTVGDGWSHSLPSQQLANGDWKLFVMRRGWPSCGLAGCSRAARFVDAAGVGFCPGDWNQGLFGEDVQVADGLMSFDPDWRVAPDIWIDGLSPSSEDAAVEEVSG